MPINLTREALEVMTLAQRDALVGLTTERVLRIVVQKGGFDLPGGYLAFNQQYKEGVHIYGGIAPDGQVST